MTNNAQLWMRAAAIRVLRVGAAAAVATIGAQATFTEIDWSVVGLAALLAMIVEALVCVASLPEAPFPATLWPHPEETPMSDETYEFPDPEDETP